MSTIGLFKGDKIMAHESVMSKRLWDEIAPHELTDYAVEGAQVSDSRLVGKEAKYEICKMFGAILSIDDGDIEIRKAVNSLLKQLEYDAVLAFEAADKINGDERLVMFLRRAPDAWVLKRKVYGKASQIRSQRGKPAATWWCKEYEGMVIR